MKKSKMKFEIAEQNISRFKTSKKHEASVQKNSGLYFQIGLILCLLATYGLFEMQFAHKTVIPEVLESNELAVIDVTQPFQVETTVKKKPDLKKKHSTTITTEIIPVEGNFLDEETRILDPEETKPTRRELDPGSMPKIEDPDDNAIIIPEKLIEKMPIFPGCEKYTTNDQLRQCMSKKVGKLIHKQFNKELGSQYGITGKQKIYAQFTIDKNGNVINIMARAPHPVLEGETKRVLNKIPKMTPGLQKNVPVGVLYSLPITFYMSH